MFHQYRAATFPDLAGGGLPHHAGPFARIPEAFDQRFDNGCASVLLGSLPPDGALERIHDSNAEIKTLDALCRPVRGNLVARHSPHLFSIGSEENREELLAELIAHPFVESLHVPDRKRLGVKIG